MTKRSRSDAVHGARLQVHQDCPGHVLASAGLIVVHVDPLQLKVRCSGVRSSWVNTVLVGDDLPELKIKMDDDDDKMENSSKCIGPKFPVLN